MQTQDFNSDARPLPAGWTQHFEPTKRLWYYVQTSVMPPKVSFTHPIDMVPANGRAFPYAPMSNNQMPQLQPSVTPMQIPRNPSPSGAGLTFAQKLYASSMSSSSSGPMINSHSIPHLPTSQLPSTRTTNLPTPPPPSTSPPPGAGAHFLNAPLNGSDMPPNPFSSQSSYPSHQTSSHTTNHPSPNFNSSPSSAPPFPNSHRTNTFQTPILPSNNNHLQRHRASTYDSGMSQLSVNVNSSMTGPRTRHLVTMARPPDQQSSSGLSPLVLEPPSTVPSALAVPSTPPASSILFSQATGTALTLPLAPPLTTVQSTSVTPSNISSVLSVPSGIAYKPQSGISPLGRVVSGAAMQIIGGVAQSLGVGSLADGIVDALQSVLLTPFTGIDQSSLQAVIQGRPDADYQRIVNGLIQLHQHQQQQLSLMNLQMQQPPPPAMDYQALITEVQRLQAMAQAQQVATAQQQQQQALQSLQSQQQQQQQTAAQQYRTLVQQQYQQQWAAIQRQQQVLAQQQQQQQQQNQMLLNAHTQPQQQFQQHIPPTQPTVQTYLEVYKQFQLLNHQSPQGAGGDNSGSQVQPSFDPISLYSMGGGGSGSGDDNSGGGGTVLFDNLSQSFGNPSGNGGQDSGGFSDFLSVNFNQDNVDMSGQSN